MVYTLLYLHLRYLHVMGSLASTCYQTALDPSLLSLFGHEYFAINHTFWCTDVQYSVLLCSGGDRQLTCIILTAACHILIAEFSICVFIASHDFFCTSRHRTDNPFTVNEHRFVTDWWVYKCGMGKSSCLNIEEDTLLKQEVTVQWLGSQNICT